MTMFWRRPFVTALMLAGSAVLADAPGPSPEAATREVLSATPTEARALAAEVRTLERNLEEVREEVRRLRALEATRPQLYDVGDPNEHKLWP